MRSNSLRSGHNYIVISLFEEEKLIEIIFALKCPVCTEQDNIDFIYFPAFLSHKITKISDVLKQFFNLLKKLSYLLTVQCVIKSYNII